MTPTDVFRRITGAGESWNQLHGGGLFCEYRLRRSPHHAGHRHRDCTRHRPTAGVHPSLPTEEYYVDLDAALAAAGHQSMFNVVDFATGWKIDFIFRKRRPFDEEEFGRRTQVELHGVSLFVASPEDVVVAKLEWARQAQSERQIADVAALLRVTGHSLDRTYIEKWVCELGLRSQWDAARHLAGVSSSS